MPGRPDGKKPEPSLARWKNKEKKTEPGGRPTQWNKKPKKIVQITNFLDRFLCIFRAGPDRPEDPKL